MVLVDAIPELLHIVTDAEDDGVALAAAARWARTETRATLVAWLGRDGQAVVVEAPRGLGVLADEQRVAREATGVERLAHPEGLSVLVPVRYAGAMVGAVLVRGDTALADTMTEAARGLAAVGAPALRARLDAWLVQARARSACPEILGQSPAMAALTAAIARAAMTPFSVLIEGESGTGKELVARALHRLSARRDRRFAALNCAALSEELVDAELFGHTRGAFTGAIGARAGLFEDAHGGTLFLDEVADVSARTQAKLLRVLQEGEVRRLGENGARAIDARIVAATNRPLAVLVERGEFRSDLLFRLAVVRLSLPPLRDRAEDIPVLALAAWARHVREAGKHAMLGADALARLAAHTWPGNVRELQNAVAGLAVLAPPRGRVGARHVEDVLAASGAAGRSAAVSLERARVSCERRTVAAALARHGGRRSAAARELGLSRQGLTKALRRLRLSAERARPGVA